MGAGFTSLAAGWQSDANGWWWQDDFGGYYADGCFKEQPE